MSNENLAQNTETHTPKKGGASQAVTLSLLVILMGLVGWLLYDVHQLKSELSVVGAIARNADYYAHSHYSDLRLKQNVANLDDALANTLHLQAVTFNWNVEQFPSMGFDSQTQIGLIAQDVEQIYPELVSVAANGYKIVDYAGLTPILLEAIKEQQNAINALQQQNAELMERLAMLESTIGITK